MITAKINGLELMGVLQLAYFSLAQQEQVNVLLEPFMRMKNVNGFNADFINEDENALPDQLSSLGIRSLFLSNCNVMLLLIILELTVAGVLLGLSRLLSCFSEKLACISNYLIK